MSETAPPPANATVIGDDVGRPPENPFHLTPSQGLIRWMDATSTSLVLSTYEAGKVVMMGPGTTGALAVSERKFDRAMAMVPTPDGFWLSTQFQVWRFQNALGGGRIHEGWDALYLPRRSHVTGAVDTHDLAVDADGRMLAAVTLYNCIGQLDDRGNFNPLWRPAFIDQIVAEDRCHLNGFCLEEGALAYVSLIAPSNRAGGWREGRRDQGLIMDARTGEVVVDGLSMPHSPRLGADGRLWLCEAGTGWVGFVDLAASINPSARRFERVGWCPGFVRGLRLMGEQALIGVSKPRAESFQGLALDDELATRGLKPQCGLMMMDLATGAILHRLDITGSVGEIYDVMALPGVRAPYLVGTLGEDISRFVYLGPDVSLS